jgi:hypothetical protein
MKRLLFFTIIVITVSGCQSGKTFEGIPVSDSYNQCSDNSDFGELTTIGDPGNKFMITMPYSWDIQEVYSDTIYGIFGSNAYDIGNDNSKLLSLSVSGYKSEDSLATYFRNEIKSMKKSSEFRLLETGNITIDYQPGFWLSFELEEGEKVIYSIIVYLKRPDADEIFLLQTLTYKSGDWEKRICSLKAFVETFEFEE